MAMIDRYKKSGGFLQLLILIETCAPARQEKFLSIIHEEAPAWEDAIRRRLLTIDRIMGWNVETLTEVVTRLQPLTLAVAVQGLKTPVREKVMKLLSHTQKRQVEDRISVHTSAAAEISSANLKILAEVREMAATGLLRFEKFDPELFIEENIEEKLSLIQNLTDGEAGIVAPEVPRPAFSVDGRAATAAEEMESLRRKVANLTSEVTELQKENRALTEKLHQIRKFAS